MNLASALTPLRRRIYTHPKVVEGRRRRYESFVALVGLRPSDRILDVASGSGSALEIFNQENPIVAVDLIDHAGKLARFPNVTFRQADATKLPFADNEFDVVFCNSLIEHIPLAKRQAVADEIMRVGRRYFVQTPNRWFPIEPHYLLPLVQMIPRALRHRLDRVVLADWIELLDAREMQALFPDATIEYERIGGMTKSLMAVRHDATAS